MAVWQPIRKQSHLVYSAMAPIIGITTRQREVMSSAGTSPTHTLNRAYTLAVERAGGIPILLTSQDPAAAPRIADRLQGLILSGGGDIEPSHYGGSSHEALYGIEPDRDRFEFALIAEAKVRRLPVLAICRGMQVVNVALGGSLHEDILDAVDGAHDHFLSGDSVYETPISVRLDADCRLGRMLGQVNIGVNSIHHQSVRRVAPELRAVGWGDDGIIEAVEHEDDSWSFLGVQWHPEYLSEKSDEVALQIFDALIAAADGTGSA